LAFDLRFNEAKKYEVRKKSSFIPADLLYEAIVDSSDDVIVSKNLQSIVISWNKGAVVQISQRCGAKTGDWLKIPQPRDGNVVVQLMNLRK